jgi:hypothetical protein
MRTGRLTVAVLLTALYTLNGQSPLAMPAWLAVYPGASAQTSVFKAMVESTYVATAKPAAVNEHYRKLFEAQNLPFVPNYDGMGTVVRAAAPECDLMITIHALDAGTEVRVDCSAKSASTETWTAVPDSTRRPVVRAPASKSRPDFQTMVAEANARHQQLVKDLNIHPVYHDAPAPPLVWPAWLVHLKGGRLVTQAGVDPAGHDLLKSRYKSNEPMTAIYAFYEDLLNANGYPVHNSKLGTGQTTSGIVQNADGHVEGFNYPNGHPGPYTEIRVDFHRFYLNEPITVDLKFTTYAFKAPPPFGQ